jgi:hypothetical protein
MHKTIKKNMKRKTGKKHGLKKRLTKKQVGGAPSPAIGRVNGAAAGGGGRVTESEALSREDPAQDLWSAAKDGKTKDVMRIILENKDDLDFVNWQNPNGYKKNDTPLSIACERENEDVVLILTNTEEVDANIPANGNITPLWLASFFGCVNCVRYLLMFKGEGLEIDETPSPDLGYAESKTPLEIATEKSQNERNPSKKKGYEEIVKLLQTAIVKKKVLSNRENLSSFLSRTTQMLVKKDLLTQTNKEKLWDFYNKDPDAIARYFTNYNSREMDQSKHVDIAEILKYAKSIYDEVQKYKKQEKDFKNVSLRNKVHVILATSIVYGIAIRTLFG